MSDARALRGRAAIVGAADAVYPTGEFPGSLRAAEMDCVTEALAQAGLTLADVDGIATCTPGSGMQPMELAEYLGITPRWADSTNVGGSSFEVQVDHAVAAIASGLADVVLITYANNPRSSRKRGPKSLPGGLSVYPRLEWEMNYGVFTVGAYALAASRHMAMYGTTSEQLAQIAVSTREWAALNPKARFSDPLTVAEVVASPLQAAPLHLLDCCLVTDGAGALVLTSAERARDLAQRPAYILGAATAVSHTMISEMPDLTVTPGAESGRQAFEMAGLAPSDVDVAQLYDSVTITVLLALEDLGFCAKGEGGAFVEDGRLGPGGAFPAQTSGGGLSYTHPGMFGMFLLVEAVRQVQGSAGAHQVPGVEVALAHGCGGSLSSTGTVLLGTEGTL